MAKFNVLGLAGIGVSGLALIFGIVSFSSKYWEEANLSNVILNIGLWEYCLETSGIKICTDVDTAELVSDEAMVKVNACRAMMFLGIFGTFGAIVSGVLVMFVMKSTKILYFAAGGVDIFSGVCFMIAMAVYAGEIKNDDSDLHAGFALAVVAWITAWIAGGIFIGAKIMDKD
ncbi:uncharacterized protein LOC123536454 [Mercenaria mercenaria]|uniref:uncharacterized protein LOC123536454 n=1 Tax=Mercenaria mercenaria TaxID=6596 RepID=UPI001E1D59A7|nr:uncharacterized protein LOC123536454 [Mercenaria mercenaria]